MENDKPANDDSLEALERVKREFPLKRVKRIVIDHDGDMLPFVLTAPNRIEWKKYRTELEAAKGNTDKAEFAIECAALAMIRWPEREVVREIFDNRPGIIQLFAEPLGQLAGIYAEVSAKNA